MKTIFEGMNNIILEALYLDISKSLKQKSTCINLKPSPDFSDRIEKLLVSLFAQLENNWAGRIPSSMNWKIRKKTNLNPINQSPEILLERAIAILSERDFISDWYNQLPIASGLIDEKSDKRAAIDLVISKEKYAEFIELKWESDTPIYAAFEIIRYALAFLFCYKMRDKFGYADYALMNSNKISLRVLAPLEYYAGYNLEFLQNALSIAIHSLYSQQSQNALSCDFSFLSFPANFTLPFNTGAEVTGFEALPKNTPQIERLIIAVNNIKPLWKNDGK